MEITEGVSLFTINSSLILISYIILFWLIIRFYTFLIIRIYTRNASQKLAHLKKKWQDANQKSYVY